MNVGKRRILLVDDEPAILKVVGRRLELAGYEVVTASDGEEGLSKAQASRPDAIILDLMMPRMDGFQVCERLKKDPAYQHIPIIILTARGKAGDERRLRELGADAYLSKPMQSHALLEQLEALLGNVLPEDRPPA